MLINMDVHKVALTTFTVVTVPMSLCLIFTLIAEIWLKRNMENSFYRICLVTAFIDLICFCNTSFVTSLARWGVFTQFYLDHSAVILYTSFFVSWGFGMCQFSMVGVLALNRYTALMARSLHTRIWTRFGTYTIIVSVCCCSLCFGLPVFLCKAVFLRNDREPYLQPKLDNAPVTTRMFLAAGTLCFTVAMFVVLVYVRIFLRLRQVKQGAFLNGSRKSCEREQRLLVVSVVVCSTQLIITIYLVCKAFLHIDMTLALYNFINTIFCGINPYILLGFSSTLRSHLCCSRPSRTTVSTPNTTILPRTIPSRAM